jgi:hypothetical protein
MVRYNNRWLPRDMVTQWEVEKDTMIDKMVGNSPENQAMLNGVLRQANASKGSDPFSA